MIRSDPYPPAPRRPRYLLLALAVGIPIVLIVLIAVFVAVLVFVLPDDDEPKPAALRVPLELKPVLESTNAPCAPGTLPSAEDGTCLRLGQGMTVTQVADLRATPPNAQQGTETWSITIRLRTADVAPLAELTRRLATAAPPGNRLAIVVSGRIVSAPVVTEPLTTGDMVIAGNHTRSEVEGLIARITGSP